MLVHGIILVFFFHTYRKAFRLSDTELTHKKFKSGKSIILSNLRNDFHIDLLSTNDLTKNFEKYNIPNQNSESMKPKPNL